jgi:hypothetical protein
MTENYPPCGGNAENLLPWLWRGLILPAVSGFSGNQSVAVFSNGQEGRLCRLGGHWLPVRKAQRSSMKVTANNWSRVHYRSDERRRNRFTTVEIIVEEFGSSPPEKPVIAGLPVDFQETELQGRVKRAGGRWNSAKRVWEIHYDQTAPPGLKKRIVSWRWLILDIIRCQILDISV